MQTISRDHVQYALDASHAPIAHVRPTETFVVETHDCRAGAIRRPDQVGELEDGRFVNPATGPIFVDDARPGDVVAVEILELAIDADQGLMLTKPLMSALNVPAGIDLRIVTWDAATSTSTVGGYKVPAAPMIGLIGVAPAGNERITTSWAGDHGGNMDNPLVGAGSTVYLRAATDGALLYVGDAHAAQGDGEVFMSGIEIAARATLRVTRIEDDAHRLPTPLVETADLLATGASGRSFEEAAGQAMDKAVALLTLASLDPVDAGFLMSACGNLRLGHYQPRSGKVQCRFEFPKAVLDLNGLAIDLLPSRGRPTAAARPSPGS
jgi:amidase